MRNIGHASIWSLGCLVGGGRCGVAWRRCPSASATGAARPLLGLAFALVATRTRFPFKRGLRLLTILPIITPPFVIGLALDPAVRPLRRGHAGVVGASSAFDAGRWLYGLTGIWIAQVLSFTPIAFLVLIGVVEGVSPSMEEAAQTLRADRWRTFWTVSLPLMRPGLANAFLVGFIESMADFGNPLVLGGSHGVLSTEIFFAVVGAQNDPARAAVLALVLLVLHADGLPGAALLAGRQELHHGDRQGRLRRQHVGLAAGLAIASASRVVLPWVRLHRSSSTRMILFGGFVKTWGLDNTLTLEHYVRSLLGDVPGRRRLPWTGVAWDSFWTTMEIALVSAPLTAAHRPADRLSHRPPALRRPRRPSSSR